MLTCLKSFVHSAWAQEHSRRSCLLIFSCQLLLLFSLLGISYVAVHVYVPEYNARRLSKHPLVCSTVQNEWVTTAHCELPWDHNHITIQERLDHARVLYENDSHSATLSLHKPEVGVGGGVGGDNSSQEIATERHFTWSSCGEFCSSDLVDQFGCRQLRVRVRKLGSHLIFKGCTDIEVVECPFLREKTENEASSSTAPPCSTAGDNGNCLRLGIFRCKKSSTSNPTPTEETTTPPPPPPPPAAFERLNATIFELFNNESAESNTTTTAPPTSTTFSPTPTTTPTSGRFPLSPLKDSNISISKLEEALECSHIEKLVSCNMSKMDREDDPTSTSSTFKRFNCSSPSSSTCFKSPGTYICDSDSVCRPIPRPDLFCSRTCEGIGLDEKNVVIADQEFGRILTARCVNAYRGKANKVEVWPGGIKHKDPASKWRTTPQLLVTCNRLDWAKFMSKTQGNASLERDISASDCFNGTRLENSTLPPSATLRSLEHLWTTSLLTADFDLDAISQKDAPPSANLTLHPAAPLYLNDFYQSMGEGCALVDQNQNQHPNDSFLLCSEFYGKYGKLPGSLQGQSVFPCYCRSLELASGSTSPFCVVGEGRLDGVGGFSSLSSHWEDGLVELMDHPYSILILVFLVTLFLLSLGVLCLLLYPLVADLTPVSKNLVLVGVGGGGGGVTPTPNPSSRLNQSPKSGRSVKFIEDQRTSSIFTVGGGSGGVYGKGSTSPGRRESIQEIRRSRSNSIVSVM